MNSSDRPARKLFGIAFSPLSGEAIADIVTGRQPISAFRLLVTANLDHIAQLTTNKTFRAAYDAAWAATIDGTPVHLYARLRGERQLPKVTGSDLLPLVLDRLVPGRHRPFFVASRQQTADLLVARAVARGFSPAEVGYVVPPMGFETDAAASAALLADIVGHGTTHLFMGVGAPKSEIWMYRHRASLPAAYGFGFGTALDYAAGTRTRAPRLFRALGIEWMWRVGSEPRRLFKRYFVQSWLFVHAVIADLRSPAA